MLYVVHGLNPFSETRFADQLGFTDALLAAIDTETRPVVVAGDFNTSDRVLSYRSWTPHSPMRCARDPREPPPTRAAGGPLMLRIDHVFVTRSWCAAEAGTFTPAGSDHLGVEVSVGPCT